MLGVLQHGQGYRFEGRPQERGEGALHQYLHKYLPTKPESSICIKHISIESYVNYYAINLDQVISQRKINDTRFTTG